MKLNCKILTMLCVLALGRFAQADLESTLKAEAEQIKAAGESWKSRCQNVDNNSPEGKQCMEEGAQLQARLKSLEAVKAEAERLQADANSWISRCRNVDKNSAEGKQCMEEIARLQAREKSLAARVKPATGQ